MITIMRPSVKMAMRFHDIAASVEDLAEDKWRRDRDQRNVIDIAFRHYLDFVIVNNAKKHDDEDFDWTALWCIRSSGHYLHIQDRFRKPTNHASHVMTAGSLYLFDSRLPHWTENGAATLICAACNFAEKPDTESVHAAFDARIDLWETQEAEEREL